MKKLSKAQKDLLQVCKNKNLKTWDDIRSYAYNYKKYDNLTLRDIDMVYDISNLQEWKFNTKGDNS